VFFTAGSSNGLTTHSGSRWNGTEAFCPFAISVQTSLLLPKSFGTVIVKTPQARRVWKDVGWPRSGPPGSMRLFGPTGISSVSFRLRLK
jgi:hypothetical protein